MKLFWNLELLRNVFVTCSIGTCKNLKKNTHTMGLFHNSFWILGHIRIYQNVLKVGTNVSHTQYFSGTFFGMPLEHHRKFFFYSCNLRTLKIEGINRILKADKMFFSAYFRRLTNPDTGLWFSSKTESKSAGFCSFHFTLIISLSGLWPSSFRHFTHSLPFSACLVCGSLGASEWPVIQRLMVHAVKDLYFPDIVASPTPFTFV